MHHRPSHPSCSGKRVEREDRSRDRSREMGDEGCFTRRCRPRPGGVAVGCDEKDHHCGPWWRCWHRSPEQKVGSEISGSRIGGSKPNVRFWRCHSAGQLKNKLSGPKHLRHSRKKLLRRKAQSAPCIGPFCSVLSSGHPGLHQHRHFLPPPLSTALPYAAAQHRDAARPRLLWACACNKETTSATSWLA